MIPFGEMAAPVMNRFVVFTGHSYILHEPGKTGTKQDKQNHAICLKSPYPSTLSKWVQRASSFGAEESMESQSGSIYWYTLILRPCLMPTESN
jgi:hypothetical protein